MSLLLINTRNTVRSFYCPRAVAATTRFFSSDGPGTQYYHRQERQPEYSEVAAAKYWIDPESSREDTACGFTIVRCTYTSPLRWDKYISSIHADVQASLRQDPKINLNAAIKIPIIEDERLEGASWKEARARFDQVISTKDMDKRLLWKFRSSKFFIFADRASVDSVVDCGDGEFDPDENGQYYFTLVASGLTKPLNWCEDENGVIRKDCEECFDCQRALWQKFKVFDLVHTYASIAEGLHWPDMYPIGDDGISGTCSLL